MEAGFVDKCHFQVKVGLEVGCIQSHVLFLLVRVRLLQCAIHIYILDLNLDQAFILLHST
jgi:hypothetical protein